MKRAKSSHRIRGISAGSTRHPVEMDTFRFGRSRLGKTDLQFDQGFENVVYPPVDAKVVSKQRVTTTHLPEKEIG
jgi:hypothetical protein